MAQDGTNLGYKSPAKIWRLLKSLQKKGLITREPTRSVGKEKIGLDPTFWDQVLIDTHHASELKRHLKIVPVPRTNQTDPANEPSTPGERTVQGSRTDRSDSEHEKDPRLLQTSSDCSQTAKPEGESFTQETENGDRGSGDGNPPIATASAGASPSRTPPDDSPDPHAHMHPAFRKFMNGPPFAS